MFSSKTQKDFKQGKKLVAEKKWQDALTILQPLQSAKDVDQVELLSLIHQAQDGIFNDKVNLGREAIKRQNHGDALRLLQSLLKEYPDKPVISELIQQAQEGAFRQRLGTAQSALRMKKFDEALQILRAMQQEYADNTEIEQLITQTKNAAQAHQESLAARRKTRNKVMLVMGGGISRFMRDCCDNRSNFFQQGKR